MVNANQQGNTGEASTAVNENRSAEYNIEGNLRKPEKRRTMTVLAIIAAVLAVAIVTVAGYGYWERQHGEERAYQRLQKLSQKPVGMNDQGGLPAFKASNYNPEAPSVDIYVDYFCPDCADLDHVIYPTLKKLADARQINVYLHPVNFLDAKTKNHYSTRSATVAAYISSHEPDTLLDFTKAMFADDFMPSSKNGKDITDKQLSDLAIQVGVSKSTAEAATNGTYSDYVTRATKYTLLHKALFVDVGNEHRFSSPTIVINGAMWTYRDMEKLENTDPALIHVLGLEPQDVGNPKAIPSIGSHSKALPIPMQYL
ncbi:putative DsbA family dithiol-disulfide isomerase [Bifidobacterium commune]|nr:DsbA family protein [Bifidobacterium commune]MBB2954629.1 putative DsbA family dithiol-disulfide isomerase [Bifidobacterium commune]